MPDLTPEELDHFAAEWEARQARQELPSYADTDSLLQAGDIGILRALQIQAQTD